MFSPLFRPLLFVRFPRFLGSLCRSQKASPSSGLCGVNATHQLDDRKNCTPFPFPNSEFCVLSKTSFLCHLLLPSPTHHIPTPEANICFSCQKTCQSTPDPFQTPFPPQSPTKKHSGQCKQLPLFPSGRLHPAPHPPAGPSSEKLKSAREAPEQLWIQFHLSLKISFCLKHIPDLVGELLHLCLPEALVPFAQVASLFMGLVPPSSEKTNWHQMSEDASPNAL